MKRVTVIILFLSLLGFIFASQNNYDFKNKEQNQKLKLLNFKGRFAPKLYEGALEIVNGAYASNQNNAVVFPDTINNKAKAETYKFNILITPGAEGAGFVLLNKSEITNDSICYKSENWEAPNFKNSFSVGFDVYNPQTSAIFDSFGNFYGREQREISLHWNNKEIYKICSPVEYRSDLMKENLSQISLKIEYLTAGANISLSVNDTLVINNFFIPEMTQYEKIPIFGARSSDLTTSFYLTNFEYKTEGLFIPYKYLGKAQILKDEIFHAGRRDMSSQIKFENYTKQADKAILTLDLSGAPGGLSAWDVGAAVYLIDKDSVRHEICRFITPYNRAYIWKIDASDFLPLFSGKKGIFAKVDTWETTTEDPAKQKGWKLNCSVDFYKGNQGYKAFETKRLWSGYYEYGNPENPMQKMLPAFNIDVPKNAVKAKLRIVVTGHGMSPNSENAGEFRPSDRIVKINGHEFKNLLWKTDCYLNPCRPQDGTWKFDRTGWAPGSIPFTWEIDISDLIQKEKTLKLEYLPDNYINTNRGEHYPPHQWFESEIIFYKKN